MRAVTRIVSPKTGQEVFCVETNTLEWDVVSKQETIILTNREIAVARSMNINKEKFLKVKRLLLEGKNSSTIYQETKIARTTIDKYKTFYCSETQEKLMQLQK